MGMNIERIIQPYISAVVPRTPIAIFTFKSQSNVIGKITIEYNDPIITDAQVEVEYPEKLQHIQGVNLTGIYKRFYIQSDTLTGLNRNLSTGGDYIVMNNLKYKIVEVIERFGVGWVQVIGNEGKLNG